MNLGQKIIKSLAELRHSNDDGDLAQTRLEMGSGYVFNETSDGIHLKIEVMDFDKLSFLVHSIELNNTVRPDDSVSVEARLKRQADKIEKRLTYLLESFHLVELDRNLSQAQVRSAIPYREDGATHYYEVVLDKGNALTFSRFVKSREQPMRKQTPFHLSDQTLGRLIGDLVGVLRDG